MQDPVIPTEDKVQQAELAAQKSREQFEAALGQLADRVDETTETAKKVIDAATAPADFVNGVVGAARENIRPRVELLARETKDIVVKVVDNVKKNPRPYIIGAAAACAGAAILLLLLSRRTSGRKDFDTLN